MISSPRGWFYFSAQSKRRKLKLDTQMAHMAARDCTIARANGRYFSLEHPKNSIARGLESWRRLEGLEGVFSTEYHAEYSEGFCEAYAAALHARRSAGFSKVFSGRNSPLSHAIGRRWGVKVPEPTAVVDSEGIR